MPMRRMSVLQAKRFGVFTTKPSVTLRDAAREMQHHNVSALVVTDAEGYLVGVITRTDLVRAAYLSPEWPQATVADFMNRDVVTVFLDDSLMRVAELLINHHIHRVVAVEAKGDKLLPVAVLSAADIVYHMVQDR